MAIKMHEPIWDGVFGPLFVRAPLGAYFFLAGWYKLGDLKGFVKIVQSFHLMPEPFATLYGILLPYTEMAIGVMLIVGLYTTLAAITACLALASFVWALGIFPQGDKVFNKDILLLLAAFSLLYTGAGAFSIDRFRKTG